MAGGFGEPVFPFECEIPSESFEMKRPADPFRLLAALVLLFFLFPQRANAYLDPGTGSYLFQLMAAFFFGALFALKIFWTKIKTFFKNIFSRGLKREGAEE